MGNTVNNYLEIKWKIFGLASKHIIFSGESLIVNSKIR